MKRIVINAVVVCVLAVTGIPVYAQNEVLVSQLAETLQRGVDEGHWQVSADEVSMWIKTKQTDFLVVDVRPNVKAYNAGHIPGAIHIPYNDILRSDIREKLPKNKKIVLVCATGQLENLPVIPLRVLGYDVYTMAFGYAAWAKDSFGAEQMKAVVDKANTKNYPMEK